MLQTLPQQQNGWFYLSGYQLTGASGAVLVRWLEQLEGTPQVLIDFGPRLAGLESETFRRVMALKPLVTVNRQEADILWHQYLGHQTPCDPRQLLTQWTTRFACPLIVRLDSEGAGFDDGGNPVWVTPLATTVVDTIGAGDSHAGGMLAGLAAGWSLKEAVMLGNAVAS